MPFTTWPHTVIVPPSLEVLMMSAPIHRIGPLTLSLLAAMTSCQTGGPAMQISGIDPDGRLGDVDRQARMEATPPPCTEPGDPAADAYDPATGPSSGQMILPNGRALTPTGAQVRVGTFPMNVVAGRDSRYAFVTNNGYGQQTVQQIDLSSQKVVASVTFDSIFTGLVLNAAGDRLYAAGGGSNNIFVLSVGAPGLTLIDTWQVGSYPTGLALSPDGNRLFATGNLGSNVMEIDTSTGDVRRSFDTDRLPYQVVLNRDGTKAFAGQWGEAEVSVIDLSTGRVTQTISTDKNPSGLLLSPSGDRLYVANADGDTIEVFSTADFKLLDHVTAGTFTEGTHGSTPNAMALSTDGSLLFVANAGDNAIEVYSAITLDYLGAVPTGWYPSALTVTPDGTKLVVANGKGEGAGPNPKAAYAPNMMIGTVSIIPLPLSSSQLSQGDTQVLANNLRPTTLHEINCAGKMFPIPAEGMESPIEHVMVIMRENKTYDTDLGDLEVGDGDPALTLFGEEVTPNLHALAREFVVFDNFYTDSEVSVQGHLWGTASMVNDYTERTWIETYRTGRCPELQGVITASDPKSRYIFDHLWANGIDWVNYGEIVGFGAITWKNMDLHFPGVVYNTSIKDQVKAEYVVGQIEKGIMPSFTFLLLPDDHTRGTSSGAPTPESMVSDNDYATGLVVDAVSKSPFWDSTVIFIFEDDTQIGADHVEAHRSPAVVISPWTKRGYVSSVHYSIPSMFRTFELILGMPPLNQYDALATPMYDAFTATPDFTGYDVRPRQVPDETNPVGAIGQAESDRMDFSGPDRAKGLGKVLWRHVKKTEPPPMLGDFEEEEEEADRAPSAFKMTPD
jgi:YVTN family beta-propeller protein